MTPHQLFRECGPYLALLFLALWGFELWQADRIDLLDCLQAVRAYGVPGVIDSCPDGSPEPCDVAVKP